MFAGPHRIVGKLQVRLQQASVITRGRNNSLRSVSHIFTTNVKVTGGLNVHLLFISSKLSWHNWDLQPTDIFKFSTMFHNFPTKKTKAEK